MVGARPTESPARYAEFSKDVGFDYFTAVGGMCEFTQGAMKMMDKLADGSVASELQNNRLGKGAKDFISGKATLTAAATDLGNPFSLNGETTPEQKNLATLRARTVSVMGGAQRDGIVELASGFVRDSIENG